jgi:5-methylcytosine-specific restriction protein A
LPWDRKTQREYDKNRDMEPNRQFLHSMTWRKEREIYLNENPLCERCLAQGIVEPATLVHHKDRNQLNQSDENKEALCNACHEKEHENERWGK